jgi:hypothetical protein
MDASKEGICRSIIFGVALAALLLLPKPSWAGAILVITIDSGGKLHTGPITDPGAVWGNAKNLGSMRTGTNAFRIVKGDMWFDSQLSFGEHHHLFFTPGQQLLLTGQVDPDHDGGPHDREDVWGTLIAAKLLNYRYMNRNGQTYFVANILETVNPKLAALLGLAKTTYEAKLELQLSRIKDGKQIYYAIDGGVLTTGAIPEPASILLLAIPLVWLGTKRLIQRSWFRRLS